MTRGKPRYFYCRHSAFSQLLYRMMGFDVAPPFFLWLGDRYLRIDAVLSCLFENSTVSSRTNEPRIHARI